MHRFYSTCTTYTTNSFFLLGSESSESVAEGETENESESGNAAPVQTQKPSSIVEQSDAIFDANDISLPPSPSLVRTTPSPPPIPNPSPLPPPLPTPSPPPPTSPPTPSPPKKNRFEQGVVGNRLRQLLHPLQTTHEHQSKSVEDVVVAVTEATEMEKFVLQELTLNLRVMIIPYFIGIPKHDHFENFHSPVTQVSMYYHQIQAAHYNC